MKICCISDTHERQDQLVIPRCDLLLHAGDMTMRGDARAIEDFNRWCTGLIERGVARKIVCIAGNHDFLFERAPAHARRLLSASTYLEDSGAEWEGVRIWGTPWQPWFYDWAFNLRTEQELAERFEAIPEGTDILISHGPPLGILDETTNGERAGSSALLDRIRRVRPKHVVFGHIHEGYGVLEQEGIMFVNASSCDVRYKLANPPVIFDL